MAVGFPVYGSAKNNWMSDHWENVTDNVEALLIWL
jgi:GTP-binding protein